MSDSATGPPPTPDTVTEALAQLTAEGYTADYQLHGGLLRASASGTEAPECRISEAVVERMYRFEGPSDPGDEMVVFGIRESRGWCSRLTRVGIRGGGGSGDVGPADLSRIEGRRQLRTLLDKTD